LPTSDAAPSGLIAAYRLDGAGGARALDWTGVAARQRGDGILWVHLQRDAADARQWLAEAAGLDPLVVESLLAETTRPRCAPVGDGMMLFLRGVNLNPGADPEDMVSIRLWIDSDRVISVRTRRLLSVDDLRADLDSGRGAHDTGDLVAQLVGHLAARISGVVGDIDDEVDRLQEQVLDSDNRQLRHELTRLRRDIVALRRYLAPQRDALSRLAQLKPAWLDDAGALRVREESDRITRFVEDLDAARERAAVTHEEISNRLTEQLNQRLYVLSVVAAIFLPLGFLTGLFGINVGGIPLAEDPNGFVDIVLLLVGVSVLQIALFRWGRWL
jgi:zinc transporter